MSFLCGNTPLRNCNNYIRKGMSSPGQLLIPFFSRIEKTSLLAGSMTVEAALVLPVFLFFFINLSASLEMIRLYGNLEYALHGAGNEVCLYGSLLTDPMKELGATGHIGASDAGSSSGTPDPAGTESSSETAGAPGSANISHADMETILSMAEGTALSYTYVRYRMIGELGEDYLDSSPLTSGKAGLNFYGSSLDDDILDIRLSYRVGTPFNIAGIRSFMMAGRFCGHLWNGYAVTENAGAESQEQIVYITENSEVYHLTTSCTHLRLSVRPVEFSAVEDERNGSGGNYYPCEICAKGETPETVYICSSGDRYHFSGECYTLTRSYTAVPISEAAGSRRPCSRCGGG